MVRNLMGFVVLSSVCLLVSVIVHYHCFLTILFLFLIKKIKVSQSVIHLCTHVIVLISVLTITY